MRSGFLLLLMQAESSPTPSKLLSEAKGRKTSPEDLRRRADSRYSPYVATLHLDPAPVRILGARLCLLFTHWISDMGTMSQSPTIWEIKVVLRPRHST